MALSDIVLRKAFSATSTLTDLSPRLGARILDGGVRGMVGSEHLAMHLMRQARDNVARAARLERFLIIADLNIGDAILAQATAMALRELFPAAMIHYVASRRARGLITANAVTDCGYADLTGAPQPARADVRRLSQLVSRGSYDVVLNLCPYFGRHALGIAREAYVGWAPLASRLIRAEAGGAVCHVVRELYLFPHAIFGSQDAAARACFPGVSVHVDEQAAEEADALIARPSCSAPIVLFNPDATTPFTRIPFAAQAKLLAELVRLPCAIVLGAGHSQPGIERKLLDTLSARARARVTVLPHTTRLSAYAAMIDAADVFITADTGPLHLAAARKVSDTGSRCFRNRTAVISVFGATPSRLYGYDSETKGYFAANQDAPSHCHASHSPCRNLTCMNKTAKTCRAARCFEQLDVAGLTSQVAGLLVQSGAAIA